MKNDIQLHQEVVEMLNSDPRIREKEIGVAVRFGVVTLTGTVATYPEKHAASRVVEAIAGVKAVANDLEVQLTRSAEHSDTQLAHKILEALEWDIQVPDTQIKVRVVHGWVTLDGEVDWEYQKEAAVRAVMYLAGVRGVTNNLTVAHEPVPV